MSVSNDFFRYEEDHSLDVSVTISVTLHVGFSNVNNTMLLVYRLYNGI